MSSDLPSHLKAALARLTEGVARIDITRRAVTISQTYRSGGGSAAIRSENDALAYALARMPATYAAVSACLEAIAGIDDTFAPASLLDVGAGPGTATWAAAQAMHSLQQFAMLDANAALRSIALDLARGDGRFKQLDYRQGDALVELSVAHDADLVVASYAVGEVPDDRRAKLIDLMWAKTHDVLLIVEPGTPAGYSRIVDCRAQLIANGAHAIAPCPHQKPCPLTAPDWCHFTQRLARSRDHKQLKNAEVPYEDEKFSYVAVSRKPRRTRMEGRVLAQPLMSKVEIRTKLCKSDGNASISAIPRRDKESYASARRWRWGDAVKF